MVVVRILTFLVTVAYFIVFDGSPAWTQSDTVRLGGGEVRLPHLLHGEDAGRDIRDTRPVMEADAGSDSAHQNSSFADGLIFPMRQSGAANAYTGIFQGPYFDNNPGFPGQVLDFTCQGRTYDLASGYNHAGTDLLLGPYWWPQMDANDVEVIAALGGEIVSLHDGEFDRVCNWDEANPPTANHVYIRHDDGQYSLYLHFKSGSLSHLTLGQRVEQGDHLGFVGSSGFSQLPHLHFETRNTAQTAFDPFGGTCSPNPTRWRHQWAYRQSRVMRIDALSAPYVAPSDTCSPMAPAHQAAFQPGDPINITVFIADQVSGNPAVLELLRPDGSRYGIWTLGSPSSGIFSLAYWYATLNFPANAPAGEWLAQVSYNGQVYNRSITVRTPPERTRIAAALLPSSRSVQATTTATAFVSIANTSADAFGCWIAPDGLLDADFHFQTTDPATNALTGTRDTPVDIPAGQSQSFAIFLTPRLASVANSHEVAFNARCANSDDAVQVSGVNTLLMSFGAASTPDIVALSATTTADGVLNLPDPDGAAAFGLATANLGSAGTLTVRPRLTSSIFSPTLTVCRTDPGTGVCQGARASEVSHVFAGGETTTFSVFARGNGTPIPFSPRNNRLAVDIVDSNGVVRGSTSVAIRTN